MAKHAKLNDMALGDKIVDMGKQMSMMFFAEWAKKDVIPNLTRDQKVDLCKKLSDLSLETPIHIAGVEIAKGKFPELAPFMHTESLSGLQCYALYVELFHDVYPDMAKNMNIGRPYPNLDLPVSKKVEEPAPPESKLFPAMLNGHRLKEVKHAQFYAFYQKDVGCGFKHGMEILKGKAEIGNRKELWILRELTGNSFGTSGGTWLQLGDDIYPTLEDILAHFRGELKVYPPKKKPELIRGMNPKELAVYLETTEEELKAKHLEKEKPK